MRGIVLGIRLLLNVNLSPSLLRLASVVLLLVVCLGLLVAGNTSYGGAKGTSYPVADTRDVVVDLTLGLLVLTFSVLVATCCFYGLQTTHVRFVLT